MGRIALKVDVDTLRGTVEGVPRLLAAFARHHLSATFLFSLGPDHTGWALRRILRPGFFGKVTRTSVVRHYGWRTLAYGVLLPGPDIGKIAAAPMRAARDAGHECGIHCWDHVLWQDNVRAREADWTRAQMQRAFDRFADIFNSAPSTHGAAGWQMNEVALHQIDAWGLGYASDCRGERPFIPVVGGEALAHIQLPTTLPTLDELIGINGRDAWDAGRSILAATEDDCQHVFTLHAELEGGELFPVLDQLLAGWRAQGHAIGSLGNLHSELVPGDLEHCELAWGTVQGRSGEVVIAEHTQLRTDGARRHTL